MKQTRLSLAGLLLVGAGTGCSADLKGTVPPPASDSGGTTGTGGSAGSSAATGGTSSGKGGGSGKAGGSGTSGTSGSSGMAAQDCTTGTHGAVAPARRLTLPEYANAVNDLLGIEVGEKYPDASGNSKTGYTTEPDRTIIGEQGVAAVMNAAEEVAIALAPNLADVLPCADGGDDACVGTFLDTVGRRAFRRALTDEERQDLLGIYSEERADDASFSEAVAVMTSALLQMPAFLYVLEADVAAGKDRKRTGAELATKLALQLWGSVPDDTLLDAADNGDLDDTGNVRAEAERMLEDPRADRALSRFFREWSETSVADVESKDRSAFDYLDADMIDSVNNSFDMFVTDQVHSGGTLSTLLRSNTVYVNDKLADFFGLDPVTKWTQVTLPKDTYTGISTQPALLAAHAHTVSASYVFRGRFVMKRLLCVELGSPPANAMSTFGQIEKPPDPTGKETAASVEARSDCGGCHKVIDPSGLAFEHFDGMGHFRDQYDSGKAIDTTGTLAGVADDMIQFEGPVDLMEQLAALPDTASCFATQLFRYTGSQTETSNDSCSIQQITGALNGTDGTLSSAIIETTQTDGFLYRRGE